MEYHLYRSDMLGNIKTYYCSFDVASNESPFDVAKRNLMTNISNTAYFDSKYNPMTANLFIAMYIPHAIGGEQSRFQCFILSKEGPSYDVEEVEKNRRMQDEQKTRYYLYRTNSLFRNKKFEQEVLIPDGVDPWQVIRNSLSCRDERITEFNHIYDDETDDLCVLMVIYSSGYRKVDRFEYFRLSKTKDAVPLDMWEIVLLGDIRREGDHSQISFYVGPDDDPVEKATSVLRKMLENSNSKIIAASSFKHGTMRYDEDTDILVIYEFRTQFDGKTQTNIVNVYEVKRYNEKFRVCRMLH